MATKKTVMVGVRLPVAVVATIRRRVDNGAADTVGGYLRELIVYQVKRDHHKGKNNRGDAR